MSKTQSVMLPLGTRVPEFLLRDVTSGETISVDTFREKRALLVMFICRHCPYVKHVQNEIARIGRDYANSPLGILAISSNDADNFPADAPDSLRAMAAELGFAFPYCYDETQEVAKLFEAVCTPEFYLFDEKRELAYRGQLDESRRTNDVAPSGADLRTAIQAVLQGKQVNPEQKPSIGCNIKWRS